MPDYTDAQILQAVKNAIYDLIANGGATIRVTLPGRTIEHYDMDKLVALEKYFTQKVALASSSRRRSIKLADVSGGDS